MLALLFALVLLGLGTLLLVVGADWFLDGVGDLARILGVSTLVLGVVLAGLEPEEMLTAAIASARGAPALAVGNVIGTNITIVTVALGLSALISPMVIDQPLRRQALIATGVSILPIAFLLLREVSRLEGALLLAVFIGYTIFLFRVDRDAIKRMEALETDDDDDDLKQQHHAHFIWKPALLTAGGLVAMAIGGPAIVEGAIRLAQLAGLGEGVVGATIVSLGTGAEMIVLGISAARKHQSDILVGGILGSFAYNLLVTLGLAAIIHPIPVDSRLTSIALPIMIFAHLLLLLLIWTGNIPRVMGGVLVGIYLIYLFSVVVLR